MEISNGLRLKEEYMDKEVTKNLRLEGVKVIFKNFKGEERKFNRAGARNFYAVLDVKQAEKLEDEGWSIRWLEPRNEGDERRPIIKISINYNNTNRKPKIVMISGKNKTDLDEEALESLDSAEIDSADIIARPYNWNVRGASGVSAYLSTGYFNVIEDEFYKKYYDDEPAALDDDDVPF